jgi:mRNA interferase RelE/StbE
MASYKVVWKRSAEKELRGLPKEVIARMAELAAQLADNPIPAAARKLQGAERSYRVRSGDYRLIYTIETDRLVVEIVRAVHRKEAYR